MSKRKDSLIADAHANLEYAAMSAKKLATIIDADQTTISKWRLRMKEIVAAMPKRGGDPMIKAYERTITKKGVDWEVLSKKLQAALAAQIKEGQQLEDYVEVLQKRLYNLENKSWLSRLFNLKG